MSTLHANLLSRYEIDTQYNQFASPPDLEKAQLHRKATAVGYDIVNDDQLCQCCQNPINKKPLSLLCTQQQLMFLGTGYILFFKLSKYTFLILLTIFILSGSAYYFLTANACQIQEKCPKFFGFPILIHQKSENKSQKMNLYNQQKSSSLKEFNNSNSIRILSNQNEVIQQPKQQTSEQIAQKRISKISTTSSAILIFIAIILIKKHLYNRISDIQNKRISPAHYTIMVQNLPIDQKYSETQLSNWANQKLGYKPISINIAYDVSQWQSAILQRENLTIAMNKLNIVKKNGQLSVQETQQGFSNSKINIIKNRINQLDKMLEDYSQRRVNCRNAGTAFFTFQNPQIVSKILQNHQFHLVRSFFTSNLMKISQQKPLYKQEKVIISPAPAPRQVIWENLSFRYYRSFLLAFGFVCSMILIIIFGFQLQFYIRSSTKQTIDDGIPMFQDIQIDSEANSQNVAQNPKPVKHEIQFQKLMESIFLSIFIIVVNSILRLVIYFFTQLRRHYSYTKLQSSFCAYYSLTYIFNACFMVYMVRPGQNDSNLLLLQDIHLIILTSALSQPLFKICDPFMWLNFVKKQYIKNLDTNKNPYTQGYVNRIWAGTSLSNGDNYQYLIRTLFITTWFAYCAPLGVIFSLFGIAIDYWVTKYMLLRVYRTPQHISKNIAMLLLSSLDFLPLFFVCGVIQYNYNIEILQSEKNGNNIPTLINFIFSFTHYELTLIFLILVLLAYCIFSKTNIIKSSTTPYKTMQQLFTKNYQTQNPITKYRGQLNYLSGLAKNAFKQNMNKSRQGRAISKLLEIGRKSTVQFAQNKSQISKLKRRLLHRLTLQSKDSNKSSQQLDKSGQQLQQLKYLQSKPKSTSIKKKNSKKWQKQQSEQQNQDQE